MDFLDFGMAIERQGVIHYNALAADISVPEIAGLFRFLAGEEQRHFEILNARKQSLPAPALEAGTILDEAKQVFTLLTNHFETLGASALNYGDAYAKALRFEEKSIALYEDALARVDDEAGRLQLQHIIEQEHAHVSILRSLMEITRHPGEWLENAEWRHAEEY